MYRDREIDPDIQNAEVDHTLPKNHARKPAGYECSVDVYTHLNIKTRTSIQLLVGPGLHHVMEILGTLGNELCSSVRL